MRLHRLGYSNFGPFKGDQVIEFPDQDGVAVIYGDNNLGKTTILNSVRWIFTGGFPERTGQMRDDRQLVNREAIAEAGGGPVAAKVTATVSWEDNKYRLTRSATLDGDKLKRRLDVIRGSDALSAEEAKGTLQQMIPEKIQQFFLFDAEALNRYEDLLHDSTTGEELKEAIERILGIPILKNAVQDLGSLAKTHNKLISKLETRNHNAKAAAEAHAQLEIVLAKREEDIVAIQKRIDDLKNEKGNIEQRMAASEKALSLLEKHRRVEDAYGRAKADLKEARENFKSVAPQAWAAVLTPTIETKLDALKRQRGQFEIAQRSFDREQLLIQLRTELNDTGECPCCGQAVSNVDRQEACPVKDEDVHDQSTVLAVVKSRIEALERILNPTAVVLVDERNKALSKAEMRVQDLYSDLTEAEEDIDGLEDRSLGDLPTQLANTKTQISNRRKELKEAIAERDEERKQAAGLLDVVAREGGEAGEAAMKKQRLLASLQGLFADAVDDYRQRLKQRVEQEATGVFLSIRSDPDFVSLSINEDYGLSIVHKDGELEPQRSAGYEHIVALSLLAALQRCAPINAPIFMDMPFARLDPNHTLGTLKALPTIAEQVVLIVLESEIDHTEARNSLGSDVLWIKKLARRSARHTEIIDMGSP